MVAIKEPRFSPPRTTDVQVIQRTRSTPTCTLEAERGRGFIACEWDLGDRIRRF
jgi:hypothetical protein